MADNDSTIEAEKDRFFRRNVLVAPGVDLFFGFATSLIAIGPILAVLLAKLGASNLLIGMAPAATLVGSTLLQLPAAHFTHRLRRKKVFFALAHVVPCSAWVVAGVLTPRLATPHPQAMILVVLGALTVFAAGNGFLMPIWTELLARMYSDGRRGFVTGLISMGFGTGGLLGGAYAAYALGHRAFPLNYAHLFVIAGLVTVIAVQGYLLGHEVVPAAAEREDTPRLLPLLRRIWAEDARMRRYLLVRNLYEFAAVASAFFAVYAMERFRLSDSAGGSFVVATSMGYVLFGVWAGRLGDARGYRRLTGWGMLLAIVGTFTALVTGQGWVFYVIFVLVGAAAATDFMSTINILIEMSDEKLRPHYYALYSTALAPVRLLGPLFWGWLGDAAGLRWAFLGSLVLQVVALGLLLALVDDPRRPGRRLLRWPGGTWRPRLY
jgi:MFS family permease